MEFEPISVKNIGPFDNEKLIMERSNQSILENSIFPMEAMIKT